MVKNLKSSKKDSHLRIPPQSIESEMAVLGSIMLRKDAMHEVEDMISPDSFYVEKHKKIFQAMLDLSLKNEPIDMLSLSTKLAEKKIFCLVSSHKNQKDVNLKDALPEAYERLEKLRENKGMLRGLATGFKDLDVMLSGLQKSDLIIIAARPSMGKTTLALDIARMTSVIHEKSVVIF